MFRLLYEKKVLYKDRKERVSNSLFPKGQLISEEKPLKPSLSTKILSINDFITKLLSKLPRDLSNRVHF